MVLDTSAAENAFAAIFDLWGSNFHLANILFFVYFLLLVEILTDFGHFAGGLKNFPIFQLSSLSWRSDNYVRQ